MRKGRDRGKKKREKNKREKKEKTDEKSGHYVIASSRLPERRPLERQTLAPILRVGRSDVDVHTYKRIYSPIHADFVEGIF